ncbi:hypothetical protein OSSY52_19350 [Tepiditoga spiralis]|uniref:Radical SAM core domain-containing protein n=1 Tax=Tepiditoga spiralis TaxID=2108365 RepID=A0A7G1G9A8_9BACT|nr:radical SAM protein [Tepiditoga spiralis]BBE31794.1 hypothetical protein OSSY52_19350 [Tepiditoga spiralis]
MRYFRLNMGSFLIKGKEYGAIYDTLTGNIIRITKHNYEVLESCENNNDIDELNKEDFLFLEKLYELNVGMFYSKPIYIEKLSIYDDGVKERFSKYSYIIKNLFIEFTNRCNLECKFCNEDDEVVFRKTGCKKWKLKGEIIDIDKILDIISQAKKLGCESLYLIGGEPFMFINKIKKITNYSHSIGINNITIFTNGTILDDNILAFLKKNNVNLIVQILGSSDNVYKAITKKEKLASKIYDNVISLAKNNINYSLSILINSFNENEIEEIIKKYNSVIDRTKIRIDYIYPNKSNKYHSEKYKELMYSKEKTLSKISLIQFLTNRYKHNCYGNQIAITGDGEVIPCIMSRKLVLGNIRENKLVNILRNSNYKELYKLTKDKIDKCKNCELRYGCFDCRALESNADNNLLGIKYCKYADNY